MTGVLERPGAAAESDGLVVTNDPPIRLSRHPLDQILTGVGAVAAVVLLVAGGLLS
jgi:hypothetical protein